MLDYDDFINKILKNSIVDTLKDLNKSSLKKSNEDLFRYSINENLKIVKNFTNESFSIIYTVQHLISKNSSQIKYLISSCNNQIKYGIESCIDVMKSKYSKITDSEFMKNNNFINKFYNTISNPRVQNFQSIMNIIESPNYIKIKSNMNFLLESVINNIDLEKIKNFNTSQINIYNKLQQYFVVKEDSSGNKKFRLLKTANLQIEKVSCLVGNLFEKVENYKTNLLSKYQSLIRVQTL